ncbi:MAG TPA: hypothetical protein PLJ71_03385 [Candidatus Hydrogenedentes bacterium]|nr:hypothetical protein [Candidatus Hydrogenedentota bacterium]HQM47701.1 hypothetical protein [Candidatus Hydrogenedentota bacterium]
MILPFTSIVRHELVRRLRGVRPFLLVVFAVCVASMFVISAWPWDAAFFFTMGGESSQIILITSLVVWCFAAVLVLPAYGGASIVLERQQETFDQVFLTLITPTGIILGKLLNTLGMYLLIMVSMLPLVATLYFLVGIELGAFFVSVAILLSVAYSVTCISLLCSVLSRNVQRALVRSLFFSGAAIGGMFLVAVYIYLILSAFYGVDPSKYISNPEVYVYIFVPFASAVSYAFQPYMISAGEWLGAIAVQLVIGTVCLVFAANVVRRIALLPLQKAHVPLLKRLSGPRAGRGKPAKPLPDGVNPIYAREVLWEGFARTGRRLRTLFLALLVEGGMLLALLLAGHEYSGEMMAILWSGLLLAAVGISAPMATASSVTREGELGNLDMLRMTLLRPYQVILGKTLAGLRGLSPLFIAAVLLFPLVLYGERQEMGEAIGVCLVSFGSACVFALVGTSLGILASALSKRTTVAVMIAYIFNACAYFMVYLFVGGVINMFALFWSWFAGRGQEALLLFNKFDDILMLSSPMLGYFKNASEHFHRNEFITPYWLTNVFICTSYSLLALWAAIAVFRLKWAKGQQ